MVKSKLCIVTYQLLFLGVCLKMSADSDNESQHSEEHQQVQDKVEEKEEDREVEDKVEELEEDTRTFKDLVKITEFCRDSCCL